MSGGVGHREKQSPPRRPSLTYNCDKTIPYLTTLDEAMIK